MRSSWSSSLSAHEMPISMLVSHEASSSARNGGSVRWSMKKKKVLGSLVSRTCGVAIRAKDVIATRSPSQRIASPERAQEGHRSLPAIAGGVGDPHRRRAVLQHHQVDAGPPHPGGHHLRPRQRQDHAGGGADQAQPEQQPAEDREALAHRDRPVTEVAAHVGPPAEELPHPDDQQRGWTGQQPQVLRLPEDQRLPIDGGQGEHRSNPCGRSRPAGTSRASCAVRPRWRPAATACVRRGASAPPP